MGLGNLVPEVLAFNDDFHTCFDRHSFRNPLNWPSAADHLAAKLASASIDSTFIPIRATEDVCLLGDTDSTLSFHWNTQGID